MLIASIKSNAMKTNQSCFFLSIVLLLFHSCTVEKRHYTNGYHVEVFSQRHADKHDMDGLERPDDVPLEEIAFKEDVLLVSAEESSTLDARDSRTSNVEYPAETNKVSNAEVIEENFVQLEEQPTILGQPEKIIPTDPSAKKTEGFIFLSFVLTITGFLAPIASVFFFTAGLISAIIGRKRALKHPEKFSGARLGIAAILFSVFGLVLFLWVLFAIGLFAI